MTKTKEEIAKQKHEYYLRLKASGKTKIYQKTNRVRFHDKRIAYTIEWRKRNPDKLKATQKKRLIDGRAYLSVKKYAQKNPDKVKAWHKKSYQNYIRNHSSEELKRIRRDYYQKNSDKIKSKTRAYFQSHKTEMNKKALALL
ncbi:MAG: hypothetical protein KKF08_19050 [Gammaproteobacteria bacterium]|nr:hypothetical protein [Gammaproteobacteria bacterium]